VLPEEILQIHPERRHDQNLNRAPKFGGRSSQSAPVNHGTVGGFNGFAVQLWLLARDSHHGFLVE
jgi:hypothetical protein